MQLFLIEFFMQFLFHFHLFFWNAFIYYGLG